MFVLLVLLSTILANEPQNSCQPTADLTQICAMKLKLFEFSTFSSIDEMERFNENHPESGRWDLQIFKFNIIKCVVFISKAYKIVSKKGVSCDDIDVPNVPHAEI